MDLIKTSDSKSIQVKRAAIDAIYSIATHCKAQITYHKDEILDVLDSCRTDINLPVRNSAQETTKLLREIAGPVTKSMKARTSPRASKTNRRQNSKSKPSGQSDVDNLS